MEWRTMTAKQLAERLDGREYLSEITPEEEREAEANGLVAVYGYSDDNVELVRRCSRRVKIIQYYHVFLHRVFLRAL